MLYRQMNQTKQTILDNSEISGNQSLSYVLTPSFFLGERATLAPFGVRTRVVGNDSFIKNYKNQK